MEAPLRVFAFSQASHPLNHSFRRHTKEFSTDVAFQKLSLRIFLLPYSSAWHYVFARLIEGSQSSMMEKMS